MVRLPGSDRAIALTTDCAERLTEADPRQGGRASVLEAARNLACTGARPVAATDCLNFPNPEKGSTGWRLAEAIAGMSDALRELGVPVVSGNVSLYNESATRAILPTPVVGMLGLLERADRSLGHGFGGDGDVILVVGDDGVLDGSEYARGLGGGQPDIDVEREVAAIELVLRAADEGVLLSAHDVSGGGLAVALAESAIAGRVGAVVQLAEGRRVDEALFGEGGGRMMVTVADDTAADALIGMAPEGVLVRRIGTVGGDLVTAHVGEVEVSLTLAEAAETYERGLPEALA